MKIIKLNDAQKKELYDIVSEFRTYKKFSKNKEKAYRYAKVFQIRICPYCNIHYIDIIPNVTRPEFDHYIPISSKEGKGKELDTENLIPSCHVCNSVVKRNKLFKSSTHLHPFHDDFDSIMEFRIDIKKASYISDNSFNILFNEKCADNKKIKKAKKVIKDLKLDVRYQYHIDYVIEILQFIKHYNESHVERVLDMVGEGNKEIYTLESLLFGYINSDINNTPLGKLRRDILNNYLYTD